MSPTGQSGEVTRAKLCAAALETLRSDGIAALSARTVAGRAGVNQALIFYHYATLAGLVDAACRESADAAVAGYRERFAAIGSFAELLAVGREMHAREREIGNVTVMAQLLAGAQRDEQLAATSRYCLDRWRAEVDVVARRVLRRSPLALVVDPAAAAYAIAAGFIGVELYEGVDPDGANHALDSLERLGALVEVIDDLGPVGRRALRATLRRRGLSPKS